jgi:hypothetical protein
MRPARLSLALGALFALASCGGSTTSKPTPGDPAGPPADSAGGADTAVSDSQPPTDYDPGDTSGDPAGGDGLTGDNSPGDETPMGVINPSTQLCAAGSSVASSSYHGVMCLSPLGSGGPVSTSSSYKLIPGPAHIVEAQ